MLRNTGRGGAFTRIEWPTVGLIALCYGVWFAAGFWIWPVSPVSALAIMSITVALQSSLMHEVLHGHPTRNAVINEALISLPIGLVWPYRRFKSLHLRHHHDERLTDPFDDPESFYQALWQYRRLPKILRLILRVNNVLLARVVLGPILGVAGLVWTDLRSIFAGNSKVGFAWVLHGVLIIPVIGIVVMLFEIPLWLYLLVPVWVGHGIISIRTYAEHQWSETPDGRTIIVERSILGFLFLNNNLHFVHHDLPGVPWYQLPSVYWNKREEWQRRNGGYVYPNYLALLAKFGLRAKEPVVHPQWRRVIEQRFIFLPEGHGQDGMEGANMRPVAESQRD
ncbi:MAG: fatty acid desaturase [Rhizobiaceae bacterium]